MGRRKGRVLFVEMADLLAVLSPCVSQHASESAPASGLEQLGLGEAAKGEGEGVIGST